MVPVGKTVAAFGSRATPTDTAKKNDQRLVYRVADSLLATLPCATEHLWAAGMLWSMIMAHPNLELIEQFFVAYSNRDRASLQAIVADQATWTFPGHHPLSGTKVGLDAIIAFFDAMGTIIGSATAQIDKLVLGVTERYVVECQHLCTSRVTGPNLDLEVAVLWAFADGKIVSGKHLVADQDALGLFFTSAIS